MTRDLRPGDWPEVEAIFRDGIATGVATFEAEPPTWAEWDAAHSGIRLVAELEGRLAGWCALSPVSERRCYRGVGRALLEAVIARSEAAGIWTLQAGIFPENAPSIRLHLGCGFRLVGMRERLGEADGVFRDVLLLERRAE